MSKQQKARFKIPKWIILRLFYFEFSIHWNVSLQQLFLTFGKRHFFSNKDDSLIKKEDLVFWKRYKVIELKFK